MTCFRCKGDMEPALKTHAATLERCVIIVKNVPAIVDRLESIIKEVAIVDYADGVA